MSNHTLCHVSSYNTVTFYLIQIRWEIRYSIYFPLFCNFKHFVQKCSKRYYALPLVTGCLWFPVSRAWAGASGLRREDIPSVYGRHLPTGAAWPPTGKLKRPVGHARPLCCCVFFTASLSLNSSCDFHTFFLCYSHKDYSYQVFNVIQMESQLFLRSSYIFLFIL